MLQSYVPWTIFFFRTCRSGPSIPTIQHVPTYGASSFFYLPFQNFRVSPILVVYFKLGYVFVQRLSRLHSIHRLYKSRNYFWSIFLFTLVAEHQPTAEPRAVDMITLSQPSRFHPFSPDEKASSLFVGPDGLSFVLTTLWFYFGGESREFWLCCESFFPSKILILTSENFKWFSQRK